MIQEIIALSVPTAVHEHTRIKLGTAQVSMHGVCTYVQNFSLIIQMAIQPEKNGFRDAADKDVVN